MATGVRVCCRFRPLAKYELERNCRKVVGFGEDGTSVMMQEGGQKGKAFNFDHVFPSGTSQADLYATSVKPVVKDLLDGYNGTVFAYGQTGAGKTFTMTGVPGDAELQGVIPRLVEHLFQEITASDAGIEYTLKLSMMEVYMEHIRDLLDQSKTNLKVREVRSAGGKSVYVEGVTELFVSTPEEIYGIMDVANSNRKVSSTSMNATSSRSHSIFQLTVSQKNAKGTTSNSHLYLIDLAGSEKVGKTNATGQTLNEAKAINGSLSALGNVINALTEGKSHIPYRDSKLTRILQESLGGNARTTLIINCSPADYNMDETVSTLRFGIRAKRIVNKAKKNVHRSPAELKKLLDAANKKVNSLTKVVDVLTKEVTFLRKHSTEQWDGETVEAAPIPADSGDVAALAAAVAGGVAVGTSSGAGTGVAQELQDALARLERMEEEKVSAENSHSAALDQLEEKNTALADIKAELEAFQSSMGVTAGLEGELKAALVENASLKENLQATSFESQEAALEVESLQATISDLQGEVDQLKARGGSSAVADPAAAAHREAMKVVEEAGEDQAAAAEAVLAEKDRELSRMEKDMVSLKQEVEEERKKGSLALERVDASEKAANAASGEVSELRAQLEAAFSATTAADSASAASSEQMVHMQTELARLGSRTKNLENDVARKEDALKAHKSELSSLQRKVKKEKGRRSKAEDHLASLRKETLQHVTQTVRVKNALVADLESRCAKVIELELALDALRDELAVANNNGDTTNMTAQVKKNLEELTSAHKDMIRSNRTFRMENRVLEQKLTHRSKRIHELDVLLQKDRDASKAQMEEARAEVERLQRELAGARGILEGGQSAAPAAHVARPIRGRGTPAVRGGAAAGGAPPTTGAAYLNALRAKQGGRAAGKKAGGRRGTPAPATPTSTSTTPGGAPGGSGTRLAGWLGSIFSSGSGGSGAGRTPGGSTPTHLRNSRPAAGMESPTVPVGRDGDVYATRSATGTPQDSAKKLAAYKELLSDSPQQ